MTYRRVDLLLGVVVALFAVAVLVATEMTIDQDTRSDALGPRAFPRILATFLFVGGTVVAIRARRLIRSALPDPGEGTPDEPDIPASARRAFALTGLTIAYALLLPRLGYLIATPAYVAGALYLMGVKRPTRLVAVPIVLTLLIFTVFAGPLNIPLPSGLLTGPIRELGFSY